MTSLQADGDQDDLRPTCTEGGSKTKVNPTEISSHASRQGTSLELQRPQKNMLS